MLFPSQLHFQPAAMSSTLRQSQLAEDNKQTNKESVGKDEMKEKLE